MNGKYSVRLGELVEEETSYEVRTNDGRIEVCRNGSGQWLVCELERVGQSDLYLLMMDNRPTELYLERRRGGATVTIGRHTFHCDVAPWRPGGRVRAGAANATGIVRITAPMTGSIVEVRCEPGATVGAGEVLLVIESMKMNNELRSPAAGTVESVPVVAGQRVNANALLVALRIA